MCKIYGVAINAKKTKVMVANKSGSTACQIILDNMILKQVAHYKYLGSWITDDIRCDEEINTRIAMAKVAFWQNKEIM